MIDFQRPHRRYNPLTGEWILVSPQRTFRPWLGQIEKADPEKLAAYEPDCYLCPGNRRAEGIQNPEYRGTFVFDNDFPALFPISKLEQLVNKSQDSGMLQAEQANGVCRVVCFSPRHDLTLPELSHAEVAAIVRTWSEQSLDLGQRRDISYVQVFENKGAVMGCSNPHPHSQIWSTSFIPNEPAKELKSLKEHKKKHGGCLLCDYLEAEKKFQMRLVAENKNFSAIVPFWAIWPYECLLISQRHIGSLNDLIEDEVLDLADILRQMTIAYDNLFEIPFPYSMGFHQSPTDELAHPESHLHAHFYPPLLRSATVRKFMVGFEMLAMPQRDLTAEVAAETLRSQKKIHYKAV